MSSPWYELLANLAILSMLVLIWSNAQLPRFHCPQVIRRLAFGLLLGLGVIIVMLRPFEIEQGVFVDLRATLVAVSALFGGPLSLIVTASIAAAFRIYIGGIATCAGLTGIGIAGTVGLLAYFLKKQERPSSLGIVVFSASVAGSGVFTVSCCPMQTWRRSFPAPSSPL